MKAGRMYDIPEATRKRHVNNPAIFNKTHRHTLLFSNGDPGSIIGCGSCCCPVEDSYSVVVCHLLFFLSLSLSGA